MVCTDLKIHAGISREPRFFKASGEARFESGFAREPTSNALCSARAHKGLLKNNKIPRKIFQKSIDKPKLI